MCQPTIVILSVKWTHRSVVAHGYGPRHSSRQLDYGWLVVFVIFNENTSNPLLSEI
jgi:hypothetical protein